MPKQHLALIVALLAAFGISHFSDQIDPYHLDVLIGPIVIWQLRSRLRVLAIAVIAASVFAVPTYALTYSFTGNPMFPTRGAGWSHINCDE